MEMDSNEELKDMKSQSSKSLRMKMASILKASGDFDTLSEVSWVEDHEHNVKFRAYII